MQTTAYAKINWALNLTGKRPDGYHLLNMLMQPIALHDDLTLTPRTDGRIRLTLEGAPGLAADETNLACRAASALRSAVRDAALGVDIHLVKRIPSGAGLGGGSADAAAVLHGLNRLWDLGLTDEYLQAIGLTLGADVPFCVYGRPAQVTGIGEVISPLLMARSFPLVLLHPCAPLPTRQVFETADTVAFAVPADIEQARSAFASGQPSGIAAHCRNMLQPAAALLRPELPGALCDLTAAGAFLAMMTGSGSVVFGAFETDALADAACKRLSETFPVCIRTHTLPG